jgi:hypothetical protein
MKLFQVGNFVFDLETVSRMEHSEESQTLHLHFESGDSVTLKGEAADLLWRVVNDMAYLLTNQDLYQYERL